MSKPGISFSNVGNWFPGYEIASKPYNIRSPDRAKAEDLKPQLDAAQTNFIAEFNIYTAQLNTLPAGSEKNKYAQTLNSSVSQFNSAFGQAAQYYKGGDGPKLKLQLVQIGKIKAHLDTTLNLMHDVVERPGILISQASTEPSVQPTNNGVVTTYNANQAQTQTLYQQYAKPKQ